MLRQPGALHVASIIGFLIALGGSAEAGSTRQPMQLSDAQLDEITAGTFATGTGTGSAQGTLSHSQVALTSFAGSGSRSGGIAAGLVTASAASTAGRLAKASSTLSLTVICQ